MELKNRDIGAPRLEYYFRPPQFLNVWITNAIKDQRDLPLAYMLFNVVVLTFPSALLVFLSESWIHGFLHWLLNSFLFQERFMLGLHYLSHLGLFRNNDLNTWTALILSPFFGLPSGMYYLHHVIMHHVENNKQGWDLSSTEIYQRDSVLHFVIYWLRFLLFIWFELPVYAWKRQRYGMALSVICCVLGLGTLLMWLYQHFPCGTFWVFLFPTFINSLALMLGNWSQHIFVDPQKPRCNYHLTYNVINDQCNQRSFNDGYHTEHHVNSRRHWTELPQNFMANLAKYAEEDAIVFTNLDPIKVGMLVFMRKYKVLAQHLVQFRSPPRTDAEVEEFLRARLVPIKA